MEKMGKSEEEGRGFAFHSRMEMGVAGVGMRVIKRKVWWMQTDRRERWDQLGCSLVVKYTRNGTQYERFNNIGYSWKIMFEFNNYLKFTSEI